MSHRAQQIVDAAAAILAAASSLRAAVYTHRRYSLSALDQELPAVSVAYGDDSPLSDLGASNLTYLDSLIELQVVAVVKAATEQDVLSDLLDLRAEIHKALIADRSLGLAFVIDTRYGGASAPDVDVSLDTPAGSLVSRWSVHYRMNLSDPS